MEAGTIMGAIFGIAIGTVLNSIAIYIVGKLGLGMTIKNLGTALLAGLLTAVFGVLVFSLTGSMTGDAGSPWLGHLLHLVISAVILLIIGRILSGMETKGFVGALVAAAAIALLFYLVNLVLGGAA